MSIAAAIDLGTDGGEPALRRAVELSRRLGVDCFAIAVVRELPYGTDDPEAAEAARRRVERLSAAGATPVIQEGADVAKALALLGRRFGVRTLFVPAEGRRRLRRSVAERLVALAPPFDLVVVAPE